MGLDKLISGESSDIHNLTRSQYFLLLVERKKRVKFSKLIFTVHQPILDEKRYGMKTKLTLIEINRLAIKEMEYITLPLVWR